jgi:CsoR family transcriptional regulator, copper-sensing transcriptional repressor
MDQKVQTDVLQRLRNVDGHVRAIMRMVEEGQPCTDLIQQARAVRGAMRQVSILLLCNHLDTCLRNLEIEDHTQGATQLRQELIALVTQIE